MIRLNIWIKKKNIKLRIFSRPFVLKTDSWFFLIVIVWFEIKSFCMSIFFINLMQFTCLCSQYVIDIIKHDCQWCSFFFKKEDFKGIILAKFGLYNTRVFYISALFIAEWQLYYLLLILDVIQSTLIMFKTNKNHTLKVCGQKHII